MRRRVAGSLGWVSTPRPDHFEPHIQGLRAIAVLLVVVFHIWPGRLTGGYIGVDVFFVISGFLITGQLVREIAATGRVRLGTFWAKRARRLLPAAILVIIVSAVLCLTLMPVSSMPTNVRELLASTFYVQNWALVGASTDYLAGGHESIAQHYWSLSLEEQFYVVWPLLLLLAAWLAARGVARRTAAVGDVGHAAGDPAGRRRRAILWAVVVVGLASYILSGVLTQLIGPPAYFTTYTRMWEFAVGALLALLPAIRPSARWLSAIVGWLGVLLVLGAGWFFDRQTAFPGWIAMIPVLGTALAIAARRSDGWWLPGRVLAIAPMRFFGDISYSLYLWHWPLIIVAPYIPGWPLQWWNRVLLLVAAILLAWGTKRLVEDPARRWRTLTEHRARRTAVASVALMGVAALVIGAAWAVQDPRYRAEAAQLAEVQADPPACFGAAAALDGCENPELADAIIPSWGFAGADSPQHPECLSQLNDPTLRPCVFGSDRPDAPRVALIGDSHAYQYLDAMIALADAEGWSLTTYLKGACPWNAAPLAEGGAFGEGCAQFQQRLADELAGEASFDAIVTTAFAQTVYRGGAPAAVDGLVAAWTAAGSPIVAVVDNPSWSDDPNKCLRQRGDAADCTVPRAEGLDADDPLRAAGATSAAAVVDLSDVYCPGEDCGAVIGGANVYRDKDHLTATWVSTLIPLIRDAIGTALAR